MSEGLKIFQPSYRWFAFEPAEDITLKELANVFRSMQLSVSEEILAAHPELFRHFKPRDFSAIGEVK
jgi:hypothetical protein